MKQLNNEQLKVLKYHQKNIGVLEIKSDLKIENREDLSLAYTPGVAILSELIKEFPETKKDYTMSGKLIAVITDGTAVLGLGNIGPISGLPVVEGKALIYKDLAGINALPLAIKQTDIFETVTTIKNISDSFAGIHLEDIAAPRCFEIEERLRHELDIPVYHDDQEGTAIVVLAGLINAAKVCDKDLKKMRILINGMGAAGVAIAKLLHAVGFENLTLLDRQGVITSQTVTANKWQRDAASGTEKNVSGKLLIEAIKNQDVFIGVSVGGVLSPAMIRTMKSDPIIFALANPIPEILPKIAAEAGAAVIATGSSEYSNQINNILVFPGMFKGLLEQGIKKITFELEDRIAQAIAGLVKEPSRNEIVPNALDPAVVKVVSEAFMKEVLINN
ncbi:malic enzyme, nad-dependent [Liquorilactobacillus ghanensis DSM 18630]|uniref:Malic enzyme, nad-dependent n=1 Tax=Liquorilactobacillus ghanensis DSM 18630 TaxID=1423750 RepID=A0A0R1VNA4_9LACO|nr:NADP-dependent malic enzyme [Liquorilactobacillus ghanensis]KRM07074.1 malic enzyme, nad-dependent [Liquorilactobacillus ghanensis DSM 18630]